MLLRGVICVKAGRAHHLKPAPLRAKAGGGGGGGARLPPMGFSMRTKASAAGAAAVPPGA
jgi:hypothetical protein